MLNTPIEDRVARLEDLMEQLLNAQIETQRELNQLAQETRLSTNQLAQETRLSTNQLAQETRLSTNQLAQETRLSTNQLAQETRLSLKEMDKKCGELAQKMGTMAEDLVAPSVPRVLRQLVNCSEEQLEYVAVRAKKRNAKTNQIKEFDVIVVCGDYLLVNETKSTLDSVDVLRFAASIPEVRDYYPQYASKKLIGALASLYIDESLVRYGEKNGLIVLGTGEELMQILNSPGFKPQEF